MICPKCHTPLDLPVNVCPHCGAGLKRSGGRFLVFTAAVVLLAVLGVYGYINYRFAPIHDAARSRSAPRSDLASTEQQAAGSSGTAAHPDGASAAALSINTGDLDLKDIAGSRLGTYPVAVVSSGWFAFPSRFLIGARTWQVGLDDGQTFAVEGAILEDGDPVGLWSVSTATPLEGPILAPWTPQQPLRWQSLEATDAGRTVPVSSFDRLGNFALIPVSTETNAAGVFTQSGKIVGWSFGDLTPGGFLWTGSPGIDLIPEFYTDDFYRLTFEGSREEAFLTALSDPNQSDLQRLTALAEAHLLEARMPDDILPDRIAPAQIHQTMRRLLDNVRRQHRTEELLALFDPQLLSAIDSPPFVADLAAAAQEAGAYGDALALLESLTPSTAETDQGVANITRAQAALYGEWLSRLIAEDDLNAARSVYDEAVSRFPRDPSIHLAGVELLLQGGRWALAERRLAGRSYPPALRDRVDMLEREIADLKSQEGKLLIRFPPGSRTIPVTAHVGGTVRQPFLIDTGASVVTVPAETVHQLGIDLSGSLPRRLFYSATGAQNAIEVTLPSIEIDGWEVTNVRALVVDLPGQPGIGLLGMNYLHKFRMDLDTNKGLLTLAPR